MKDYIDLCQFYTILYRQFYIKKWSKPVKCGGATPTKLEETYLYDRRFVHHNELDQRGTGTVVGCSHVGGPSTQQLLQARVVCGTQLVLAQQAGQGRLGLLGVQDKHLAGGGVGRGGGNKSSF